MTDGFAWYMPLVVGTGFWVFVMGWVAYFHTKARLNRLYWRIEDEHRAAANPPPPLPAGLVNVSSYGRSLFALLCRDGSEWEQSEGRHSIRHLRSRVRVQIADDRISVYAPRRWWGGDTCVDQAFPQDELIQFRPMAEKLFDSVSPSKYLNYEIRCSQELYWKAVGTTGETQEKHR